MDSRDFAQAILEAAEETHGNLIPQPVGPKKDTVMTLFERATQAEDFVEAVQAKTGLNAWTRKSTSGPGYVAFVNNNPPQDAIESLVESVPWLQ